MVWGMIMENKPKRILCVFSTLDRGGAETMCMNIYRHIDRSKIQFDFVKHTKAIGDYENEIEELGGKIYSAPRYRIYNSLSYKKWWKKFFKSHPEYKIIHGHFFSISAVYFSVAQKCGLVTVAHSHCTMGLQVDSFIGKVKRILHDALISKIEKHSDYCLACSQEAGEWIFKTKKFEVLNNAIDTNEFVFNNSIRQDYRKKLGINPDELVVGTVGRIMRQKNPEGVIEIFSRIHSINQNTKLLWVGDNLSKELVDKKLKENNIEEDVIMTGVRNDVNNLMQAMDYFIFPSLFEGLGVVAIEAQASGLPTFCADTVPREAGITNLCVFLTLDDYNLWAHEILSYKYERKNMYNEVLSAGYDIEDNAKKIEEFYESIGKE